MLSKFDLITAKSLEEAVAAAADGYTVVAGGSDIFVMMHKGVEYDKIVDISGLDELRQIRVTDDGLEIGALATHNEIAENPAVRQDYPALAEGCISVGSTQVRNRGTIGGNICNASPAADSAGPLLLYDAIVRIEGKDGKKEVPITEFFTGVKKTVLQPGDIVTSVFLPQTFAHECSAYKKLMKRGAMEIGIMSAGVRLMMDASGNCVDARVSLSAVAPTPIRAPKAEDALKGGPVTEASIAAAAEEAYEIATPHTWRNSEEWSKDMTREYVKMAAEAALSRMKGGF